MSEPIILDGGAEMITVTLPASFKQELQKEEGVQKGVKFRGSPEPDTEPFLRIVITDKETGNQVLDRALPAKRWTIEIK